MFHPKETAKPDLLRNDHRAKHGDHTPQNKRVAKKTSDHASILCRKVENTENDHRNRVGDRRTTRGKACGGYQSKDERAGFSRIASRFVNINFGPRNKPIALQNAADRQPRKSHHCHHPNQSRSQHQELGEAGTSVTARPIWYSGASLNNWHCHWRSDGSREFSAASRAQHGLAGGFRATRKRQLTKGAGILHAGILSAPAVESKEDA